MKKYLAEFIGTAVLVLFGCGSVAVTGFAAISPVWFLAVALAFGLSVATMAYGIGPISGCHINPAVSVGVWAAGRLSTGDLVGYVVSQVLGGIAGAALLYLIVSGKIGGYDLATSGLGQNGWGEGYGGGYGTGSAILAELIGTFVFLVVILGSTSKGGVTPVAGLAIGLTLVMIHIVFIPVTGVSVNPARSIGPALFVGGKAIEQLWLFIVIPPIGALLAGLLFRAKLLED
ncbi:MIP family channel protein [Ancylobacter sp. Lp-2]|uniref:MIP family channel protein n=1 Tax=Ancylobacter sp. Lp-2 TaxID=2881339 RepID=UPI001E61E6F8|nr:MIP family channel protein [Ancylobacter sp. Lp-2]MCB4769244.1 MIP family channel protein [Ancylobacter sp. Lp-2]